MDHIDVSGVFKGAERQIDSHYREMLQKTQIKETVIMRLSMYMHYLTEMEEQGKTLVSSSDIAQVCGVTAGLVRKDLARFGKLGVKGIGYHLPVLSQSLKTILGLESRLHIAIIGRSDLGLCGISFTEFLDSNYVLVALFDTKTAAAERSVTNDIPPSVDIFPLNCLEGVAQIKKIDIAIVNTMPSEVQHVVDQVVNGGIRGIINLSPVYARVPKGYIVKNVCFATEQDNLIYLLQSQSQGIGDGP
jgi:redox-sensing transcriptional repressor